MEFRIEREAAKARRLIAAVLSNLDAWISELEIIEANANPGNRIRSLHLLRNMAQARMALQRMASDDDDKDL